MRLGTAVGVREKAAYGGPVFTLGVALPHDGETNAQWRRRMVYRTTDEVVRAETGLIPLSVSADRIAHAAFRATLLLSRAVALGHFRRPTAEERPIAAVEGWIALPTCELVELLGTFEVGRNLRP
jgi:hypothetical protein